MTSLSEFQRADGAAPIALVTGAARRIGRALATALAGDGFRVAIHHHHSTTDAETLAAELTAAGHPPPLLVQADLAQPAAITALFDALPACPAVLVNSASLFHEDQLTALSVDLWQQQMQVNALAPALLIGELARRRAADEKALVVNMSDAKLAAPNPDFFSYTVAKFALSGVTEMAARALAPDIRVNAIAPSVTLVSGPQSRANFAAVHAMNPLQRGVVVADLERALAYLVHTPTVTGQTLTIDSGQRFLSMPRDVQYMIDQ